MGAVEQCLAHLLGLHPVRLLSDLLQARHPDRRQVHRFAPLRVPRTGLLQAHPFVRLRAHLQIDLVLGHYPKHPTDLLLDFPCDRLAKLRVSNRLLKVS